MNFNDLLRAREHAQNWCTGRTCVQLAVNELEVRLCVHSFIHTAHQQSCCYISLSTCETKLVKQNETNFVKHYFISEKRSTVPKTAMLSNFLNGKRQPNLAGKIWLQLHSKLLLKAFCMTCVPPSLIESKRDWV